MAAALGLAVLTRLWGVAAWWLERSWPGGPSCTNPLGLTIWDEQRQPSACKKALAGEAVA